MDKILKLFNLAILVGFLVALMGSQATAAPTLSFNPSSKTIAVGDILPLEIVVSGLEPSMDIGAFDFNVLFDDSVLSFDHYTLGTGLGTIPADAADWSSGDLGGGTINLAEVSYLTDLSFQSDSFMLALASFTAVSAGSTDLSFSNIIVSDAFGSPLTVNAAGASINVVPVPCTILLLGSGLLGLMGFRRHQGC